MDNETFVMTSYLQKTMEKNSDLETTIVGVVGGGGDLSI